MTRPLQAVLWQPMKTAPRDGTHVLLWHHGPKVSKCVIGFCEQPEVEETLQIERWVTCAGSGWHVKPIHWMPLPPSPFGGRS